MAACSIASTGCSRRPWRSRRGNGLRAAGGGCHGVRRGAVDMQKPSAQEAGTGTQRRVTILGSTGSVGCNTIDLIARDPGAYAVEALVAGRKVAKLIEQARQLR